MVNNTRAERRTIPRGGDLIPVLSRGVNRIDLVLSAEAITALTGLLWSWGITHRAGGALLNALILTLLVATQYRKPVFTLLDIGIVSPFVIDYFRWQPTGQTNRMRWPFLDVTVDDQGFYRSTDRWPAAVATIVGGIVLGIDRFVIPGQSNKVDDVSSAD